MKNPWKRYSKINPQRDDGNRQICNAVFHALIAADFTGAEYKIILAIIDKTWGFGKNDDSISINQFAQITNLSERTVQRTLKKLHTLRVVYLSPFGRRVTTGSPLNKYSFNKHYDTWKVEGCQTVQGCQVGHPPKAEKGDICGNTRVTPGPPTKETITKEIILKKDKKKIIKRKTYFPNNYKLEQKHIDYANSKGITDNLDDILEGFCIYHRKKGTQFVDWYAVWQTWIRNKIKWDKEKQEQAANGTKLPKVDYSNIRGRDD